MNNIREILYDAIRRSPFWTQKTKSNGHTIQGLVCSVCGDPNAWAYENEPWAICCNRLNSCGARVKTLELFPEVIQNIEKEFPANESNPHLPATKYLESRRLSDIAKGTGYRYIKNARGTGSGAVMFPVSKDESGKETSNGRLFNPPPGFGKTHNIGSTAGLFWKHPEFAYSPNRPTYITEGIFNALSLLALHHQAIAVLSAGQDPNKLDLSSFPVLVLSFDNDEAGRRACQKWKTIYPEAEVILCDQNQDWNDLIQSGPLDQVKKNFEENLPRYRFNGDLAMCNTAKQYADIYYRFHQRVPGLFTFQGATFFCTLKTPRGGEQEPYVSVDRCLQGVIRTIYYILERSNPARPQYLYTLEIQRKKGRPFEAIATGDDLASNRKLNEWLLSSVKCVWEGDAKACIALAIMITSNKTAPEVKQLAVIGHQQETDSYIFPKWAVDISGKLIKPDKRGFFKIGLNQYFRPPVHSEGKNILPVEILKKQIQQIYNLIGTAWGLNGITALSWIISGWFVNQIKEAFNFFPFLSLYGDPASGKSALTLTLNAIQGREGEGLPITSLNSKKGLTRTIGQLSGLSTALLEDNERNDRAFDFSILLTAYNKGPLQVQATFSNDLQTREAPFLGSLLFCQNIEPFNSKAEKQRVISLHFKADMITDTSRSAYEELMGMDRKILAGVIQQTLINRDHFKGWREEFKKAIIDLSPMTERRILENHALILAFHRLFCKSFKIDHDDESITRFFSEIGREKCLSSTIRQTTTADHFFELIDGVDDSKISDACHFNHDHKRIYINLPRIENLIRNKGINFQANESFHQALQKHPAFIRNSYQYRFPDDPEIDSSGRPKQRRVWVFSLEWFNKNGNQQP